MHGNTDIWVVLLAMLGFIVVFTLPILVLFTISYWKIFVKAGEPGWKALIPLYSGYIMYKLAWTPKWFFLVLGITTVDLLLYFSGNSTLAAISWLLTIANFVISIFFSIELAKAFGKSGGFAVGLILVPFVFYPILAFGKDQYIKGQSETDMPVSF